MDREALDIDGVCHAVSLARSTVYDLIRDHRFPPGYKAGRRRLWSRRSIEDWVRRSERKGVAVG